MRRTEALEGLRMMKFRSVLDRRDRRELSQLEPAKLLEVGERRFGRWCGRHREGGEPRFADRRLGRAAANRVPAYRAIEADVLYRTRYAGFTDKHLQEHLGRDHAFAWGYTRTKALLRERGLLTAAAHRAVHWRKRSRRPQPRVMLHQDAVRNEWVAGAPARDLVVTLNDATSAIFVMSLPPARDGPVNDGNRGDHEHAPPPAGGMDPAFEETIGIKRASPSV